MQSCCYDIELSVCIYTRFKKLIQKHIFHASLTHAAAEKWTYLCKVCDAETRRSQPPMLPMKNIKPQNKTLLSTLTRARLAKNESLRLRLKIQGMHWNEGMWKVQRSRHYCAQTHKDSAASDRLHCWQICLWEFYCMRWRIESLHIETYTQSF